MKLRSSKAACYVGVAIVLFMTPVLPAVATTYEKTQNTDTELRLHLIQLIQKRFL